MAPGPPVFVQEVLLEHSYAHWFRCCLCCFLVTGRDPLPATPKVGPISPLTEPADLSHGSLQVGVQLEPVLCFISLGIFWSYPRGPVYVPKLKGTSFQKHLPPLLRNVLLQRWGGASFKEKIHKVPHGNDSVVSAGSQLWPLRAGERV